MNFKKIIVLSVVLLFLLRVYKFGQIPFGINRDEAALGYNAFSILKTGMDEHARSFPLQFESFGDWKKPVYIYLSIIPIALFGLSIQSTRIIAFIAAIFLISYITKTLQLQFGKSSLISKAPWLVALFLMANPWHFFFSRIAVEAIVAAAFFSAGHFYLQKQKGTIAITCFIATLFTYHAALVFVPLWLAVMVIHNPNAFVKKSTALTLALFILIVGLQYYATFFSAEKAKAQGLVIYDLTIDQQQEIMSKRTSPYSIVIHNKYVFIAQKLITNYAKTFTPEFLINKGGGNPSYNVPGFGNFYVLEIVLAAIGAWHLIRTKHKQAFGYFSWLAVAPLPGAITFEAIHSTREIFLLPVIGILAAVGASWLINSSRRPKTAFLVIYMVLAVSAFPFYRRYFSTYQAQSDNIYHGYMKDISLDIKAVKRSMQYHRVIVEFLRESPYIFYAFYNQLDPADFHRSVEYYPHDWEGFIHVKKLDGIEFAGRDENDVFHQRIQKENNLIYSKPRDVEYWIKPYKVWDNLEGERTVITWQEIHI